MRHCWVYPRPKLNKMNIKRPFAITNCGKKSQINSLLSHPKTLLTINMAFISVKKWQWPERGEINDMLPFDWIYSHNFRYYMKKNWGLLNIGFSEKYDEQSTPAAATYTNEWNGIICQKKIAYFLCCVHNWI